MHPQPQFWGWRGPEGGGGELENFGNKTKKPKINSVGNIINDMLTNLRLKNVSFGESEEGKGVTVVYGLQGLNKRWVVVVESEELLV